MTRQPPPSTPNRTPDGSAAPVAARRDSTQPGILVLGMHRSGTSALAKVIAAMGAFPGKEDELLPAHPRDNPAGYWERTDVMLAHDRFLASTGHSWDHVAGFDVEKVDAGARRALAADLAPIVGALKRGGSPWLIKDPRLSLLLPVWLPLVGDAACVVAVRDPREIAASLVDTHRGSYTSHFLLALWEKYTHALLAGLQDRRVLFVGYASLMANPSAQLERLQRGLAALGIAGLDAGRAGAASALERGLQRSRGAAHAQLSASQAALFEWLQVQARADGPVQVRAYPDAEPPDAALAEFERSVDEAARRSRAAALGQLEQQLAQIAARLAAQEEERSGWLGELAARREHNEQLLAAIGEAHQTSLGLQQALVESSARGDRLEEVLASERSAADVVRRSLETAMAERGALQASLEAAASERDALQSSLDATQADQAALHAALTETQRTQELVRAELESTQQQREQLATSLEAAQLERNALRAGQEQAIAELAEQRRHADALTTSVHDLQVSWSWRATAPLRAIGRALHFPVWTKAERALWRWYYALPGADASRKRRLVLWLHTHAPWLTRRTLSYQLHAQAQASRVSAQHSIPAQRMDEERASALLSRIGSKLSFSLVMPVVAYGDPERVAGTIESVLRQFYPSWELYLVASDAATPEVRQALFDLSCRDARVRIKYLKKAAGLAQAANAALRWVRGSYVALLESGSDLTRDALLEMARVVADEGADLVYADEDDVTGDGRHVDPFFKPDFSLDYLFSCNFIGAFSAVRVELLRAVGGLRPEFAGAEAYDLLLRVTEKTTKVAHVPKVLLHRHRTDGASASRGTQDSAAALNALRESVARRGIEADVRPGRLPDTYRVRRHIAGAPLVSILLPFRDKPELLKTCVDSILAKTGYANYELVGIDNGSVREETHELMRALAARDERVRFVRHDVPFNYSAIVNYGVTQTRGGHLLMLNNDTEVIGAEWMEALLEHSQRSEVGAVGALLQYPNNSIQHGGVIVGLGGVAGHAHLTLPSTHPGYFGRAQVIQNLSAVTFACAMTRRDVFERMGGLDAVHLIAAYNDIDYCLRLREAGYMIVYTPYAELYHHESASRPHDLHPAQRARYEAEIRYMKERHARILERGDPYYSPNLSLAEGYLPLLDYSDALPA